MILLKQIKHKFSKFYEKFEDFNFFLKVVMRVSCKAHFFFENLNNLHWMMLRWAKFLMISSIIGLLSYKINLLLNVANCLRKNQVKFAEDHIASNILKAVFHKFYLGHFWMLCPKYCTNFWKLKTLRIEYISMSEIRH